MRRTALIMAGGSGERFWPMSRKNNPKQMLRLTNERQTMIEEAIHRINPLIPPEDIYIITAVHLLEPMRLALSIVPPENIIAEPYKRNTAPCLALAASFIKEKYAQFGEKPDSISIAVLTADQRIAPDDRFLQTVDRVLNYIENNSVLATLGIVPSRPETGYGYIEVNPDLAENESIVPVLKFHEKPDYQTALSYIRAGNYYWNSGMFFWRLDTFIASLTSCMPELGSKIEDMAYRYRGKTNIAHSGPLSSIEAIFEAFPSTSIDYGLMERAENVVVAKSDFDWDDVGSWDALDRVKSHDEYGNVIDGNTAYFDMNNSIIINNSKDKVLSIFGMTDVVAVMTDDAVLICPKDRVQEIKNSVGILRDKYGDKWL